MSLIEFDKSITSCFVYLVFTRIVEAGLLSNLSLGRIGLGEKPPLQLGHTLFKIPLMQSLQKVHSNEQMHASVDSGGRSLSQYSQFGLSSSMFS